MQKFGFCQKCLNYFGSDLKDLCFRLTYGSELKILLDALECLLILCLHLVVKVKLGVALAVYFLQSLNIAFLFCFFKLISILGLTFAKWLWIHELFNHVLLTVKSLRKVGSLLISDCLEK